MTLVILAAGMGSRYGGLKQIDPIGPSGEFIIDYSIYDAIAAGFDKVVFIIKKENLSDFEETVGKRVKKHVKTAYAFQDLQDLPDGYSVPAGRIKPWGTSHALLCAQSEVTDNFAVINSDDYYGKDTYLKMAAFLREAKDDSAKSHYAMCGFVLKNTLSENGHVARGICASENGMLTGIDERTKIQRNNGTVQFFEEGEGWTDVSEESLVPMNFWGFTPAVFEQIRSRECSFLDHMKNPQKDEFLLPNTIKELNAAGICDVKVLQTQSKWYGVTYHEDKEKVQRFIQDAIAQNIYPGRLWG